VSLLRQFLYLNRGLVRELLGQVEGGVYEETTEKDESTTTGGGSGSARIGPIGGDFNRGHTGLQSTELKLQQTDASEFNRLYEYLDSTSSLVQLGPLDDAIWNDLHRGEILEIEATIEHTGMSTLRDLATFASRYVGLADAVGASVDPVVARNLGLISSIASTSDGAHAPVVVKIAIEPRFQFRCRLENASLRCSSDDLAGEAVVVGKLGRKLAPGQSLELDDIFGGMQKYLPAEKRAELDAQLRAVKLGEMSVGAFTLEYPAADLTPIAIFR
jgi:hypothetical protein